MSEYLRPWKLTTFAIGMGWLVWGSFHYQYSDWDLGISLIMGFLAYISAPWAVTVMWKRQWKKMPLAMICWLFTVDIAYYVYHLLMGNEMMRAENFLASTMLYWLCGFIWLYNGSLRDLWNKTIHPISSTKQTTTHTTD